MMNVFVVNAGVCFIMRVVYNFVVKLVGYSCRFAAICICGGLLKIRDLAVLLCPSLVGGGG